MLVLSRRESEKVLFPALGITVEVSRIQGKTVRLGIDAPSEIRVIRGELKDTADLHVHAKHPDTTKTVSDTYGSKSNLFEPNSKKSDQLDIQKCLDATNLAIHLAQNQLRQQLPERAEEALDQALICLKELESAVTRGTPLNEPTVREASVGYRVQSQKIALFYNDGFDRRIDNDSPLAESLDDTVAEKLASLGYKPVSVSSSATLIEFLRQNEQPSMVLTRQSSESSRDSSEHSGLRMFGVGSLQKSQRTFQVASSTLTCWFTDAADESAFANSL